MHSTQGCTRKIKNRILVERKIVIRTVLDLLAAGFEISVFDGEEEYPFTTDKKAIFNALGETDEDYIYTRKPGEEKGSFVRFIYGNDGWDVINDYGVSLSPIIEPIEDFAERFQ